MSREDGKGTCACCRKQFGYYLIHNGFNESAFAYCDQCGKTCLVNLWQLPEGVEVKEQGVIDENIESRLGPCSCGGSFKREASPRCPHCNSTLSANEAATYFEANAPGTAGGWRWQRTWQGLYCVIVENKVLRDCWKAIPSTVDRI